MTITVFVISPLAVPLTVPLAVPEEKRSEVKRSDIEAKRSGTKR